MIDTVAAETTDVLDPFTRAIYLEVPSSKLVLFQAFFELFEGVALVRTLNVKRSLVCVLTTLDLSAQCFTILEALRSIIEWRQVGRPDEASRELGEEFFEKTER